jgi:folate-binding protein YgfZ
VEKRFDLVFVVNGLPLVIGEAKTPTRSAVTWFDGAYQIHEIYEKQAPAMLSVALPCLTSTGDVSDVFMCGTVWKRRAERKTSEISQENGGARGGGRTHNLRLRRPSLYPIELLAHRAKTSLLWNGSAGPQAVFFPVLEALRSRGDGRRDGIFSQSSWWRSERSGFTLCLIELMKPLPLRLFHQQLGAAFTLVNGAEVVLHYGNPLIEYQAWQTSAAVLDLSGRGRICLTGGDRKRFLHGQVTNDVNALKPGQGCYAALVNAKGKMVSDCYIYMLEEEILLDFEPGFSAAVQERLEKYIIADDVALAPVESNYGLLTVQGPRAHEALTASGLQLPPAENLAFVTQQHPEHGEICTMNNPRSGAPGFDLFLPANALESTAEKLIQAVRSLNGSPCGWEAFETARIEAGVPRFPVDMDESNLPPETGIENRAISYNKGCYIGQEIIARIRTYGQVAKHLEILWLAPETEALPAKGDKLFSGEKEAGYITSAIRSPRWERPIALGYVRREFNEPGNRFQVKTSNGNFSAEIAG